MKEPSVAGALWYLAPGLLHQLGNALFTVHGRARLLADGLGADDGAGTDARAIVDGAARAQQTLAVLRWLCGEAGPEPQPVAAVLPALADTLRVPLRDRGIELRHDASTDPKQLAVVPTPFCRLVIAACQAMSQSASASPAGALVLQADADGAHVLLSLSLVQAPGALPFPLEHTRLQELLRAELEAAAARVDDSAPRQTLRFRVPGGRVTLKPG